MYRQTIDVDHTSHNKKTHIMNTTSHTEIRTFVCLLAAQIRKADKSFTQSDAMMSAWLIAKHGRHQYAILEFAKTDGTVCRRVVSEKWEIYTVLTGTGKPKPAGLQLFADLGKHIAGKRCLISTYDVRNIIRFAA